MRIKLILLIALAVPFRIYSQKSPEVTSGNPINSRNYADPEGIVFGKTYWIYPTYSAPYDKQVFFDAFSSPDLVHWTKYERILDTVNVKWARRAVWAPSIIEKIWEVLPVLWRERYSK